MGGLGLRLGLGLALPVRAPADAPEEPTNLIENGDFSSAEPPPTLADGASIADGKLEVVGGGTATWSVPGLVVGGFYRLTFDIDAATGSVSAFLGNSFGAITYAAAESGIVEYLVAGSANTDFAIQVSGGDATIDNVVLEGPLTETGEGPELVTNGGFDDSSGWTVSGSNASIASGVFRATGGIGAKSASRPADVALVRGRLYRGRVDIPARTGGIGNIRIGGTSAGSFNSTGSKTTVASSNVETQDVGLLIGSNGNMDMDNLSIKEVLFS